MVGVRNISRVSMALSVAAGLFFWSMACSKSAQGDDTLTTRIQNADRILLGTPESTVDVSGGERFRVKIDKVFRGGGKVNDFMRVIQSGDSGRRTKFEAKRQYLFLLKKPADPTNGWPTSGPEAFQVVDGNVRVAIGEAAQAEEVAVADLAKLVADNPPSDERAVARKDFSGRWFLVLSEDSFDNWMWLVEISRPTATGGDKPGAWQGKQLASAFQASTLDAVKVQDGAIEIQFKTEGGPFRFEGKLENGVVRGALQKVGMALSPARLIATDRTNLDGYEERRDIVGKDDFVEVLQQEKPEAIRKFIQANPGSPLALEAGGALAFELMRKKASKADFEKLIVDYRKLAEPWGKPMQMRCYVDVGLALVRGNHLPELGLKYLDAAEKEFTDATPGYIRSQVSKERGRAMLLSGRTEDGIKLLQDIHRERPFEPEVTFLLAQRAETEKRPDDAFALYAELVALPLLEPELAAMARRQGDKDFLQHSPSASAKRLWLAKHGKIDGLETHLNQLYETRVRAMATKPVPPRKAGEGTRVVLCELFTGGGCPPCIGVDAALSALEATYATTELVTVRYHEHVPGFDPLANPANEQRFKFYGLDRTPAMFINGKLRPYAGPLELAPAMYVQARKEIDGFLAEKIKPDLKLAAPLEKGIINITASAGGLLEYPPRVRLILVLVEDRIEFLADNGIRVHEMIARAMPAGPAGIAPDKQGKLQLELKFDLEKFRTELGAYLAAVEKEMPQAFRDKPLALKGLKLIGFLQDVESGEVLQAAIVPVTGDQPANKVPTTPKATDKPAGPSGK